MLKTRRVCAKDDRGKNTWSRRRRPTETLVRMGTGNGGADGGKPRVDTEGVYNVEWAAINELAKLRAVVMFHCTTWGRGDGAVPGAARKTGVAGAPWVTRNAGNSLVSRGNAAP